MFFRAHGKLIAVKDILQTLRLDVHLCKTLYLMNTKHKLLILTSELDFFNDLDFLSRVFVGLM